MLSETGVYTETRAWTRRGGPKKISTLTGKEVSQEHTHNRTPACREEEEKKKKRAGSTRGDEEEHCTKRILVSKAPALSRFLSDPEREEACAQAGWNAKKKNEGKKKKQKDEEEQKKKRERERHTF